MWRALLGRRAVLLALAIGAAAAVSLHRAGERPEAGYRQAADTPLDGPVVRDNLIAHLEARGLTVDPVDLRIVEVADGPVGAGRPFAAWFTAGRGAADLYTLRGRLAPTGVPVVLSEPRNLSRTPDGHELLLDARGERVLYAVRVGERIPGVTLLDFGRSWLPDGVPWSTRLAAAINARQAFGTWDGPRRADVVLRRPTGIIVGRLTAEGFALTTDDAEIAVQPTAERIAPPEAAELLVGAPPEQEPLGLAADALRRSAVVGARRVMAVEDALFSVTDWLRRQRHRVFPTAADRLPVTPIIEAAATERRWPPPAIDIGEAGLPGEGRWQPVETQVEDGDPAALQTFVRVDPERPYERTHLFAFDMRRLGLHFVAGTRHPRSTTGVRGSGRIEPAHRARLVAAFNGGFKAEHGRFGTIEGRRPLIRPVRGLATVVTDPDGRAGFGLWDAEALAPPWTDLRQNQAPLIEAGVVNPRQVRRWGKLVADLDAARTPRSALGVTEDGVLIYGWSRAIGAERLGEAMRRAGVVFALHLDMNPGHIGLELYRPEGEGLAPARGVPAMDHRLGRWLGVDARDFFYLVRADRRPPDLTLEDAAPGEGRWRPIHRLDGAAAVSSTWIDGVRVGGRRQLGALLLEADRLRPHVVPGLAEIRPTTGVPPAGLSLPGPPVIWIDIGLRTDPSPYGFMVDGRPWRPPQPGVMTLAADVDGALHIGRYGAGLPVDGRWTDLIQGPALLAGGALAEGAEVRGTAPISALGIRADGRVVHVSEPTGDRAAAARALQLAGALDGLLLGERGTVDTGSHRLYFARGERLWMARAPTGALRPARLAAGAGTALVFTGRPPPPAARVLDTFVADDPPVR